MKKLVLVLISLFLVSCAGLPPRAEIESISKNVKLPIKAKKDEAVLYVLRPSQMGTFVRFNVFLDDREDESEMGWTRGSQHIYFKVKPGKHLISSKAENWAEAYIHFKAGKEYYLKQDPSIGFLMARNSLSIIDEDLGKYYLSSTTKGKIIKSQKK